MHEDRSSEFGHPRRGNGGRSLKIALSCCGGCFAVVAIALAVAGYEGFRLFPQGVERLHAARTISGTFLTSLRRHNYAGAAALLTPDGRARELTEQVRVQAETFERTHGPLSGWSPNSVDVRSDNGATTLTLGYRLDYKRGRAQAVFTFDRWDAGKSYPRISRFQFRDPD